MLVIGQTVKRTMPASEFNSGSDAVETEATPGHCLGRPVSYDSCIDIAETRVTDTLSEQCLGEAVQSLLCCLRPHLDVAWMS